MDLNAHDDLETHCRMLGHEVPFKYCRSVSNDLPCRRVADCWFTQFDVAAWLSAHYTPEQIAQITAPPAPKLTSLLELIEKARKQA
jgi:hypothetical protein